MTDSVADILKRNGLSITESRRKILDMFLCAKGALAHADIERSSSEHFDRVTIYRTLQTFVDKGIVHSIPTADNSVRYALCKEDCHPGHHHDNHVHFVCDTCGVMYCLEHTTVPPIAITEGFKIRQVDMLISGVCKNCA